MNVKRRGISTNKSKAKLSYNISDKPKITCLYVQESKKARNGVIVKVYDSSNNLISTYPTIASAAIYYDVYHSTMSKCIINGNLIKNHRFISELKDVRVLVLDIDHNIVSIFSTAQKAA